MKRILQNKKQISTYIAFVVALLLAYTLGVTYAYYIPTIGESSTGYVSIETKTLDYLTYDAPVYTFPKLTASNFTGNITTSGVGTVSLKANNYRASDNYNYYIYYVADMPFQYTDTTNHQAEVLLQIYYNDTLVTNANAASLGLDLSDVNYVTSNSGGTGEVSGWDVTEREFVSIASNKLINAPVDTLVEHKYRVDVVFVKLNDIDQSQNYNKPYTANLVYRETSLTYCDVKPTNAGCVFSLNYNPVTDGNTITLTNGYIYHHDSTLTNGAGDNSWRYAGANPNNYVCFGSDDTTCPADNIYRIIGLVPVDVVTNDYDPNDIIVETKILYKLIKNDYETSTSLGMTSPGYATKLGTYDGPSGNQPSGSVDGFYWHGNGSSNNTWSSSNINTLGLNTNAYDEFSSTWQNKIENVMWKVGGNTATNIFNATPMSTVYSYEITNPVSTNSQDGKTELPGRLGLMYVTDYGYAAPQSAWTTRLSNFSSSTIRANNWLFKGVTEWTITRSSNGNGSSYDIRNAGNVTGEQVRSTVGLRRTFYLTQNTTIDMSTHAGTALDPYRIS